MGEWAQLLNVGAVGVVLAWFLYKLEPRLRDIEEALDRLTQAQLLLLINQPHTPEATRREAQRMLDETGNGKAT